MGRLLIKNGKVWNGERFLAADILTENEKIAKIEPGITDNADFVFDATDKIVSAGLVDAHIHMKGISSEAFSIDASMSCIPFGVTAAVDASGVAGDRNLLDSFSVKNRVFVCSQIKNNHAYFNNADEMLEKYGDKAIGIKIFFDASSDLTDITPLKEVLNYADSRNLKVMVHSTNQPVSMTELLAVIRRGDILTHAYHGGDNSASKDDYRCIKAAKERGVVIDAGLAGNVHTDFKVLEGAIKADALPDIISTDITKLSAYKRGGKYGMTMCMSIAKHLGMNEEDIFRAVTSNPARAMNMDCGYIEVGNYADISVLEYADEGFDLTDRAGNNICSNEGYRNILTVANGDIVYRR